MENEAEAVISINCARCGLSRYEHRDHDDRLHRHYPGRLWCPFGCCGAYLPPDSPHAPSF